MKIRTKLFSIVVILLFANISSCKNTEGENQTSSIDEEILFRPNFHFTPKSNWMNDPNGMFYLDGTYHLYFQHYPDDNVWGPMHWGHATSKDLIHWKEEPIAIYPDSLGYIFSGSAVVDHNNTSGLAKDGIAPVISIFTYHDPKGEKDGSIDFQTQAIAYSHDQGFNWTKFEGNPVIENPGIRDFRDPKVVWDEDNEQWVMALAVKDVNYFYGSKNLIDWEFLSEFGKGIGAHGGVWECPDFFKMPIENGEGSKWVLLQSLNPGGPNGGSGTQYFIGDWDGKTFSLDPDFENQLNQSGPAWLDYGRDNYAGVTWSNVPDGRRLFIGWMSNWDYAQIVPTTKWRSAMTIARELKLKKDTQYYICSIPVAEFNSYKKTSFQKDSGKPFEPGSVFESKLEPGKTHISLGLNDLKKSVVRFELHNTMGEALLFGIDSTEEMFFLDRRNSGQTDFSEKFTNTVSTATFESESSELTMEVFIDKTSIEVFYNGGKYVFTEIFFPKEPYTDFRISVEGDAVNISDITINALNL